MRKFGKLKSHPRLTSPTKIFCNCIPLQQGGVKEFVLSSQSAQETGDPMNRHVSCLGTAHTAPANGPCCTRRARTKLKFSHGA